MAEARRTYTRPVALRLGLRSRILALTMPVVVLVSAAIAGIVYTSLGQVFDVSAREIAVAETKPLLASRYLLLAFEA